MSSFIFFWYFGMGTGDLIIVGFIFAGKVGFFVGIEFGTFVWVIVKIVYSV